MTSEVWRNVRVPVSLRKPPARLASRSRPCLSVANRLLNSSSVRYRRVPKSAARSRGTPRMSSLVHAPAMSGSPQGVFRVHAFPASETSGCVCASIDPEANAMNAPTAAIASTEGHELRMNASSRPITGHRPPSRITAGRRSRACMLLRLEILEVSFVSALVGVGCTPLLPLFGCRLLAATVAAVPASHHYERVCRSGGRHLDYGVDFAVVRSGLGTVFLCVGWLLPDGFSLRRAVGGA